MRWLSYQKFAQSCYCKEFFVNKIRRIWHNDTYQLDVRRSEASNKTKKPHSLFLLQKICYNQSVNLGFTWERLLHQEDKKKHQS